MLVSVVLFYHVSDWSYTYCRNKEYGHSEGYKHNYNL